MEVFPRARASAICCAAKEFPSAVTESTSGRPGFLNDAQPACDPFLNTDAIVRDYEEPLRESLGSGDDG